MSLRITTDDVKNRDALMVEREGGFKELGGVTRALGLAMWHTDIGRVTEDNLDEVFRRIQVAERVNGAYLFQGPSERWFTRGDVVRHIGMSVNVHTLSPAAFNKKIKERKVPNA